MAKEETRKKGDFTPKAEEGKCVSWKDSACVGVCDRSIVDERCPRCPKNGGQG